MVKVCFHTSYSHHLLLSHPTVIAAAANTENAEDFGFVLLIWWALAPLPRAPTFTVLILLRSLKAALFASLSQPVWLCQANLQQYMENRKKSHLSLLLTLSEEIIRAASAEIFCCMTCISHRHFSWQDYVDHRFLNRDKVSQNLGTVRLQQIHGWCIT